MSEMTRGNKDCNYFKYCSSSNSLSFGTGRLDLPLAARDRLVRLERPSVLEEVPRGTERVLRP
jgi:hypothetical protein